MSVELAVWNLLHDGCIVEVAGAVPGEVTVTVAIDYLRAMFPLPGDSFLVRLSGCSLIEFHRFLPDHISVGDLTTVATHEPEILRARLLENTVAIFMTEGPDSYSELHLRYENLCVTLENGQPVATAELANAARRYWEDFGGAR